MLISSADLLGPAAIAAGQAKGTIEKTRNENPSGTLDNLRYAEAKLVQALAETRAARWGIERRMPQFDSGDLDSLIEKEVTTIRSAHGYIPA